MLIKLPRNWIRTTLQAICLPIETIQPAQYPDLKFTYLDIGGVDNHKNRIDETKIVLGRDAPSRARQVVQKDDILISTVRTYLRNIARIEENYPNAVASTGFAVLRPAAGVSSKFLFLQILTDEFLEPLNKLQSGTSYPAVRHRDVLAQPIVLPPTAEQERIVAVAEASLSRITNGEEAALRARQRLLRYRAALLHSAITGELTSKWRLERGKRGSRDRADKHWFEDLLSERHKRHERAERRLATSKKKARKSRKGTLSDAEPPKTDGLPLLPDTWSWASIDQLSWSAGYGTSVKTTYEGKGVPVLRIPNVRDRQIKLADLKFAPRSVVFRESDFLKPGDFLIIRTNGSIDLVGRGAVIQKRLSRKCGFASYLLRFRLVGDAALWSWVILAWESELLRTVIQNKAITTAGQYNVSLSRLADTAIPLAPPEELIEILEQIETRNEAAAKLDTELQCQLHRSQNLRRSLMRDAFRGRLVKQNLSDEPVSNLLDRIRVQQAEKPTMARAKKIKKSKKSIEVRPLLQVLRKHQKPMTPEQLFAESGYQQRFEDNEYSQDVVDRFYEELRMVVHPNGPVLERRSNRNRVLLEVKR